MKMPLRERPPVPAPQKSDAPGRKKNCTPAASLLVPAVAEPVRVQPAKQKVYNMFTGEVGIQSALFFSQAGGHWLLVCEMIF